MAAGKRAGVGKRCALAEFAAAKLEHHERLLARGALDRGTEATPVLGPFHDAGDHAGGFILGQKFDVVGHLQHGLVAAGDEIIDADPAIGGKLCDRIQQAAALRHERHATGHCGAGDVRHGHREAVVQARNAHAVRARQRNIGGARERSEPRLPFAALVVGGVRKTFRDDIDAAHAKRRRLRHHVVHRIGRKGDDHAIGNTRELGQRPVAALSVDLGRVRIDRPGRHRKAEALPGPQNVGAGAALGRDPHKRDRTRPEQGVDRGRRHGLVHRLAVLMQELAAMLEHDPEKWKPVFGRDHAQTKS